MDMPGFVEVTDPFSVRLRVAHDTLSFDRTSSGGTAGQASSGTRHDDGGVAQTLL